MGNDTLTKQVECYGWHAELHDDDRNHHKFYTVVVTSTGVVAFHWGRVGTQGQAQLKPLMPSQARAAGIKKIHSKISGGYSFVREDERFTIDEIDLEQAEAEGNDGGKLLSRLFDAKTRDQVFTGHKEVVVGAYETLLERAENLRQSAQSGRATFDSVSNDLDELLASWKEIEDRHSLAKTSVDITTAVLLNALKAGSLV